MLGKHTYYHYTNAAWSLRLELNQLIPLYEGGALPVSFAAKIGCRAKSRTWLKEVYEASDFLEVYPASEIWCATRDLNPHAV